MSIQIMPTLLLYACVCVCVLSITDTDETSTFVSGIVLYRNLGSVLALQR